ncbi:MAG: Uma2 family endonuclease [Moraxellaceae bacterium]|nr:Uma2 family endonuclease [Pseudomonadales bacterium]MCP5173952.1 Uma2 family endonuclease [Moraxellaceae bacterium]MCP5177625.1 Uma2 family endonuclease [Moraxellaceae bacterium]HQV22441.1 Uma2 family endonuclease [Agitococcus sp.]
MSPPAAQDYFAQQMSEQEYLDTEPYSPVKREYIDGNVYAMAGAKVAHNRIVGNVHGELRNHLKGKPCQPYMSDIKLKVGRNYYYPDVLVDCTNLPDNSVFSQTPRLIVEVLSKSTRRMDETTKRAAYMQLDSLLEYVLIEQDFVKVEVIRRSSGWLPAHYYLGDEIVFESIGLTLAVEDIYERVQNEDMTEWLAKKALEAAEAEAQQV